MLTLNQFEQVFQDRIPGIQPDNGHFAVLVPLVEKDGELHLLFEVRSEKIDRQPKEVCFPGGRFEAGEDAIACALRETEEEIGIPSSAIRIIAPLDVLTTVYHNILHPVLAVLDPDSLAHMKINADEVQETFLAPISLFEELPFRYPYKVIQQIGDDFPYERIGFPNGYPWAQSRSQVLIYEYEGHPIWGLTAQIISWLIRTTKRNINR